MPLLTSIFFLFFFNDTATTEIYTLSLHDALPISTMKSCSSAPKSSASRPATAKSKTSSRSSRAPTRKTDRKSTCLNSSHGYISYAVFCLKKKKKKTTKNKACTEKVQNTSECLDAA